MKGPLRLLIHPIFFLRSISAYNLGNLLRDDPSPRGLLYLIGTFVPIMGLWQIKLFYDARYYVGDDLFHEWYEMAVLLSLATAVFHISTTSDLSHPSTSVDAFAYCLSIVAGYTLAIGRWIEIMVAHRRNKPGLYPEAYLASRREIVWILSMWIVFLATAVYAGIRYYGYDNSNYHESASGYYDGGASENATTGHNETSSPGESAHREVAETVDGSSAYSIAAFAADPDDVPIWMLLGGYLFSSVVLDAYRVWLRFEPRELTRMYTVPMNIDYCIHRYGYVQETETAFSSASSYSVPSPFFPHVLVNGRCFS